MSVAITHRMTASAYVDSYEVDVNALAPRPAIEWARAIMEHGPVALRTTLPVGWRLLGLKHESRHDPGAVLGWPIVSEQQDEVVLGARSVLGVDARLTVSVDDDRTLRFETGIRWDNRAGRLVWAAVAPVHRATVALLLRRAVTDAAG